MIIPEISYLKSSQRVRNKSHIKKYYPEFYKFLIEKYSDISNFSEKLYLYCYNCTPSTCIHCGAPTSFINFEKGYSKYCSPKCTSISTREKAKQTCLKKYGNEYYASTEECKKRLANTCLEKYGANSYFQTDDFKEKSIQTCLERYNKDHYFQTDDFKEKSIQTCLERYGKKYYTQTENYKNNIDNTVKQERVKSTCLKKYGDENFKNTEKRKQTCIERYGVDNYAKSADYKNSVREIVDKVRNTKRDNNSFNKSTIEEKFTQYLDDNHINYIYQYRSDLYPFDCDFYFPDKDIYLEINGFWHHGKHPFDPIKDETELNRWKELSKTSKSYKNAIETWTIRDPKKVQVAKDNNINLKVFYGCKLDKLLEFIKIIGII